MSATELIKQIQALTMKAEDHLAANPSEQDAPELRAILKAVKMTSLGKKIYHERRLAGVNVSPKATTLDDLMKMKKDDLLTLAAAKGVEVSPTTAKHELLNKLKEFYV